MKKLLLLAAAFALSLQARAAKDTLTRINPPAAVIAARMDSLYTYLEQHRMFNGNVLIAVEGKPVYEKSAGLANMATGEALVARSPFELASVSKQFTAAGILLLADRKKLRLDQQLEAFFPGFPYKGITVQMLLNHTSGLPDYMKLFNEHWDSTKIATNKDVLRLLKQYKPAVLFAPGGRWSYSNTGYALLASIIEQVSGKTYADYMQQALFTPLGMKETFVYSRRLQPKQVPHYAYGYVQQAETGKYMLPDEVSSFNAVYCLDGIQGDGTVNSTTGDMLRWLNAVQERKLLSSAAWDKATTAVVPADGKNSGYGMGWMVAYGPKSGRVLSHTGGWPGYTTYDAQYLDRNIAMIMLTNMEQPGSIFEETIAAMKKIVLDQPFDLPAPFVKKEEIAIDKSVYATYTGSYNLLEGMDVEVTNENGHLYMQPTHQPKLEVFPESPVKFFINELQVSIEFVPKEHGQPVDAFILTQNGQKITAKRKS